MACFEDLPSRLARRRASLATAPMIKGSTTDVPLNRAKNAAKASVGSFRSSRLKSIGFSAKAGPGMMPF